MAAFLRSIWPFARPYRARLILGLACGILCALANGALILAIKLVVNLVFAAPTESSFTQVFGKSTLLRPFLEPLLHWLPQLKAPSSNLGRALLIATVPAVMLMRNIF